MLRAGGKFCLQKMAGKGNPGEKMTLNCSDDRWNNNTSDLSRENNLIVLIEICRDRLLDYWF